MAKKYGTKISFDLNYRASFWVNREAELRDIFTQIASRADILIGNEEDYQLALGVEGPEAGGKDIAAKIDGFKGMITAATKQFPNAKVFATTLRQVINANEHTLGRHHAGGRPVVCGRAPRHSRAGPHRRRRCLRGRACCTPI